MVNWVIDSPYVVGNQPLTETSTTARHQVGTIVTGHDADGTYGGAEFIYLKGVASTVVGSVVGYNSSTFTTSLGALGRNLPHPVAVAMSANVASQYGWYQISGIAIAAKSSATSFAANAALGLLTTATGLVVATASERQIHGALVMTVASAASGRTTVTIICNRPHMGGSATAA